MLLVLVLCLLRHCTARSMPCGPESSKRLHLSLAACVDCSVMCTTVSCHQTALILGVLLLQEQSLVDIEMPGQYMNGNEPSPDGIVFLEGISSNVHVRPLHSLVSLYAVGSTALQSSPLVYTQFSCPNSASLLTHGRLSLLSTCQSAK